MRVTSICWILPFLFTSAAALIGTLQTSTLLGTDGRLGTVIQVFNFKWSINTPRGGKPTVSSLAFTKLNDVASIGLYQSAFNSRPLASSTFTVSGVDVKGAPIKNAVYSLSNCYVTSIDTVIDLGSGGIDNFNLTCEALRVLQTLYTSDGSIPRSASVSYNSITGIIGARSLVDLEQ